jgi:hypothetical protein
MSVKVKSSEATVFNEEQLVIISEFDGRYQTNKVIAKVISHNISTDQYLLALADGSWKLAFGRNLRSIGF